jgi:hypothetical protein
VLAQNRASVLLSGDHTGFAGDRRYLVWRWFTEPAGQENFPAEQREHQARQMVADLRAVAGRRAGDPVVEGLVARLQAASELFGRLWADHEVKMRRADRKTFLHPRVGPLTMDCETLVTPDQNQQLLVLTPADAETRERFELLLVVGIEEFSARG